MTSLLNVTTFAVCFVLIVIIAGLFFEVVKIHYKILKLQEKFDEPEGEEILAVFSRNDKP